MFVLMFSPFPLGFQIVNLVFFFFLFSVFVLGANASVADGQGHHRSARGHVQGRKKGVTTSGSGSSSRRSRW